jgi:hypothetical protein
LAFAWAAKNVFYLISKKISGKQTSLFLLALETIKFARLFVVRPK